MSWFTKSPFLPYLHGILSFSLAVRPSGIREGGEQHPAHGYYETLDRVNDYTADYHNGEDPRGAAEPPLDQIEFKGYVNTTLKIVNCCHLRAGTHVQASRRRNRRSYPKNGRGSQRGLCPPPRAIPSRARLRALPAMRIGFSKPAMAAATEPSGNYDETCNGCATKDRSTIITCSCRTANGTTKRTSINFGACIGQALVNNNGTLQCAR